MQSQYRNICACGRSIARGEMIYYDKNATNKVTCVPCGNRISRLRDAGISPLTVPSAAMEAMARVKEILGLPESESSSLQSELAELLISLRENHSDDAAVRKLFLELSSCKSTTESRLFAMRTKYPGNCHHCSSEIKVNVLVLYDSNFKRIHCLNCELPFLGGKNCLVKC